MKLLLDTNALMWAVEGNSRLGRKALAKIENPRNEIAFSTVSLWEIIIKIRVGKLRQDWKKLAATAIQAGFRRIDINVTHMQALDTLPFYHGDPFDHLILAQAIAEQATIVTADSNMMRYGVPILECG